MLEQKIDELMHKRTTESFVKSTERDFDYLSHGSLRILWKRKQRMSELYLTHNTFNQAI